MPRTIFTPDGRLVYRTRLLSQSHAEAFARCLAANAGRFRDVRLCWNEDARIERDHYVTFEPVSLDCRIAMCEAQQASRIQRADREGAGYVYALDTDARFPFYRVFNPRSGETYELTSGACSCPDYQFRLRKAQWTGVECKHIVEMIRRFRSGELESLADVYNRPPYNGCRVPAARGQAVAA